jgi:hypothetical protein
MTVRILAEARLELLDAVELAIGHVRRGPEYWIKRLR